MKDNITIRVETRFEELREDHGTPFRQKCHEAREILAEIYQDQELCVTENLIRRENYLSNTINISMLAYPALIAGSAIAIVTSITSSMFPPSGIAGGIYSVIAAALFIAVVSLIVYRLTKRESVLNIHKADEFYTKKYELALLHHLLEKLISQENPSTVTQTAVPVQAAAPSAAITAAAPIQASGQPVQERAPELPEAVREEKPALEPAPKAVILDPFSVEEQAERLESAAIE